MLSTRHAHDRNRPPVSRRTHRHARRQRARRRDQARHALARHPGRPHRRRRGVRRRAERRGDRARRRLLRRQQRRLRVARPRRHPCAGQSACRLQRRARPARRPRDRHVSPTSTPRATAARCAARTTSSSTRTAASGSPTTARCACAIATAPACFTRRRTARSIKEVIFPLDAPNGIGLSPDGTQTLRRRDPHRTRVELGGRRAGRGRRRHALGPAGGTLLCGLPGFQLFDSLAVDSAGNVCVATLVNGGITVISPDGAVLEHVPTGDPLTTNICFGGADLRTAYVTLLRNRAARGVRVAAAGPAARAWLISVAHGARRGRRAQAISSRARRAARRGFPTIDARSRW